MALWIYVRRVPDCTLIILACRSSCLGSSFCKGSNLRIITSLLFSTVWASRHQNTAEKAPAVKVGVMDSS